MKKQFNLSKMQKKAEYSPCTLPNCNLHSLCYPEEEVKEFIRLLKEKVLDKSINLRETIEWINTLAGDKLIDASSTLSEQKENKK